MQPSPPTNAVLRIDVWSDIACPWCWVGKRHLEAAISQFNRPVSVTWHAFELDPSAPSSLEGPVDYVGRLARKYSVTREQAQAMIDRMTQTGARSGVTFRFDRIQPGNTFDAHRLLHWSASRGVQSKLKERLLSAYLNEGRPISDHQTLVSAASDVGLDPEAAAGALASDDLSAEVRADEAAAMRLGVTGVPFFVFGGCYAAPGAQPPGVLLQLMQRAWDEGRAEHPPLAEGAACTPEGC